MRWSQGAPRGIRHDALGAGCALAIALASARVYMVIPENPFGARLFENREISPVGPLWRASRGHRWTLFELMSPRVIFGVPHMLPGCSTSTSVPCPRAL